ncbi:hypothetical protein HG535_0B02320 [Zygotorulaspora mrakii]|uniref:Uncharacterized protein n=1 Tax=Zygotorulaspora mrakii TaxID=42260 RepID=A0A7H9AYJ3_ZYGMR|nr:uncharacterized protein HG535_0B02320 [Zygotorulaspora mrakii]QLG71194.1 hypothetical protein HG535_0B02320 [Zygotorulaspora mrakii]
MFSVIQSPCVFEPLPILNVLEGDQLCYGPELKKRRSVGNPCRYSRPAPKTSPISMRYSVEENDDSYILSLYKKVPEGRIAEMVNQELVKLKESAYRPIYHVVHDILGNSYYLEEEQDENELIRKAMSQLNMNAIYRKVAREAFQDLNIELNHRGDELTVSSQRDGISKSFEIDEQIADVRVVGCKYDEVNEYGILKLMLEKISNTNNLVTLLKLSESDQLRSSGQQRIAREAALEGKANQDEAERQKREEAKRTNALAEEQKEKHMQERAIALAEEQRRKRLEEEIAYALAKQQKEKQMKERAIALAKEQREKRIEERKLIEAKEKEAEKERKLAITHQNARIRDEAERAKLQKKIAKEQKLKQRKAALVAEKKAARLQKQFEKDSAGSKNIVININFNGDQKGEWTKNHRNEDFVGTELKRITSPILEDIQDEELDRFNASLMKSPTGSSIIEEAV